MSTVLVAYVTKYGSTREVAEAVAGALRTSGTDADVVAARDVDDLEGYSAVVLGAPLYFFRLHSDGRHFLSRHKKALASMPVAVFALGPTNDLPEDFAEARKELDRALGRFGWLSPRSVVVFGGRLEPAELRFPDSNPAMKKMPASDIRDWDAIRAWAGSLPEALGL